VCKVRQHFQYNTDVLSCLIDKMGMNRHLNVGLHRISNHISVNLALMILLLLGINIATVKNCITSAGWYCDWSCLLVGYIVSYLIC